MRLPRDVSGTRLAKLLRRHGYDVTRQTGTLARIVSEVAQYLETDRDELAQQLFAKG